MDLCTYRFFLYTEKRIRFFTNEFVSLFSEVMLKDASKLNDILTTSIKGSEGHPELETMASYFLKN